MIEFSKLRDESVTWDAPSEDKALRDMLLEARQYLTGHSWCPEIKKSFFGYGVSRIIAVFLFELAEFSGSDQYVWVVVGDIPSLYLNSDECPNPACAIDAYLGVMYDWVKVAQGDSIDLEVPDIGVVANERNAHALKRRLDFIDREILSPIKRDLK